MAGSIAKRPNEKWRARYRDEAGKEHARDFVRKVDAQQWLDRVTATVVTDTYVDPKAGRITLQAFYVDWPARQVRGARHGARDEPRGRIDGAQPSIVLWTLCGLGG